MPRDLARLVETTGPALLRTLDRLAIHTAGTGGRFPSRSDADFLAEGIMEATERTVIAPLGEIIIDCFPRGIFLGKHSPLAAGFIPIENAIQYRTDVHRPRMSAVRWGDQRLQDGPLAVRQVARVIGSHNRKTRDFFPNGHLGSRTVSGRIGGATAVVVLFGWSHRAYP